MKYKTANKIKKLLVALLSIAAMTYLFYKLFLFLSAAGNFDNDAQGGFAFLLFFFFPLGCFYIYGSIMWILKLLRMLKRTKL